MLTPPVVARDVRKLYGQLAAVDGVSLEVEPGEVFGILGPNGAGKTTFVEILEGYRSRTSGDVSVLGVDPERGNAAWKARLGIVLQSSSVFSKLTVEELLAHFASFYPDPITVDRAIMLTGLQEKRKAKCESLSGGQKRRVDVALGIIGNPDLIFLDEPTTGFDPSARRQAWQMIDGLTSLGKTVILTTHYLDEAEHLARRVAVIVHGKIVDVASPREIGGRERARARLSFRRLGPLAESPLPRLDDPIREIDGAVTIDTAQPTAVAVALASWARELGCDELPGLTVSRPTLEDIYLGMIGGDESVPVEESAPA
jgi:ABC-2 type transport system ATP-binding protein